MIHRFAILLILMMSSLGLQSHPKKHNLSICTVFNNEAKYLKEWIEYHRLVGVDHFYLYSDNSTDRFFNVLKPYVDKGIVTLIDWSNQTLVYLSDQLKGESDTFIWSLGVQVAAYENAIHWTALKETEWLVIVDVDEFVVPINGRSLTELLEKYKQFPGIVLSRTYYDASRVDVLPKNQLIIESVGMIKNPFREYLPKKVEKMIFKPELCEQFTWPPYRCLFKNRQNPIVLTHYEGRVNHYSNRNKNVRDEEKQRPTVQIDQRLFPERQVEELLDAGYKILDREKAIYRFVPDLHIKMGY